MIFTSKEEIASRTEKLRVLMEKASLDGAFFNYKIDYFYLSGTMQDAFLYVPLEGEPSSLSAGICVGQGGSRPFDLISIRSLETVKAHIGNPRRVGFQLDVLPYNFVSASKDCWVMPSWWIFRDHERPPEDQEPL